MTKILRLATAVFGFFLPAQNAAASTDPDPEPPAGDPVASSFAQPDDEEFHPDPALLTPELRDFVDGWFGAVARLDPLDELLSYYSPDKPVISHLLDGDDASPVVVSGREGFRQLRDANAELFANQNYEVAALEAGGSAERLVAHVTVLWTGEKTETGERFAYSNNQTWTLLPGGAHGFLIQSNVMTESHAI